MAVYELVTDKLLNKLRRLVTSIYCQIGAPNGIATLGSDGILTAAQRPSGGGGGASTTQFMWVVGGSSNFASISGSPTPPPAGTTTLVNSLLTGVNVRMFRNGLAQMGFDPGNSNSFYTKVKANNTVTFSALQTGDEIIIETVS